MCRRVCVFPIILMCSGPTSAAKPLTNLDIQPHRQTVPVVQQIGEEVNNQADFNAAMLKATAIIPYGGTCPSAALERSLGMIMARDLLARPYKAGVLMTDGIFYDQPKPKIAEKGLEYCKCFCFFLVCYNQSRIL